jgi:hypothetical protein
MTNTKTLAVMPTEDHAKKLEEVVLSVTGKEGIMGFQKAFLMAEGIRKLKELLTNEYMAPIMELQGSKLGFRTDKDKGQGGAKGPGYPLEVVKDCIVEAVLNGLQVTGNHFNIIAGNMYATKEGTGYKLNTMKGLTYEIVLSLPRINTDKTGAAVDATIKWSFKNENGSQVVPIPVKMDSYTSVDSIMGKARRKANAWLISRITGTDFPEGETEEQTANVVSSKTNQKSDADHELERWEALIKEASTVEELSFYENQIPESVREKFEARKKELTPSKK